MVAKAVGVGPRQLGGAPTTNRIKWMWTILFGSLVVGNLFLSFANVSKSSGSSYWQRFDGDFQAGLPGATTTSQHQRHLHPTIHVSLALSGNHPGFLAEFEAALKSLLLHAPLERDMQVHVLADSDAYGGLDGIFNRTELSTWVTRNSIQIHAYNVTPELPWLEQKISETFLTIKSDFMLWHATSKHTIGTFFRLVAHRVIPPSVTNLLYMDTDVTIMANLEGLWRQVEQSPDSSLFHWGLTMCAGFLVINVQRIEEIWALAKAAPLKSISEQYKQDINDQLVFMTVNITHPNLVSVLADGWDMSVAHVWRDSPVYEKHPNVGMLHFNGGGSSKEVRERLFTTDFSFISTSCPIRY